MLRVSFTKCNTPVMSRAVVRYSVWWTPLTSHTLRRTFENRGMRGIPSRASNETTLCERFCSVYCGGCVRESYLVADTSSEMLHWQIAGPLSVRITAPLTFWWPQRRPASTQHHDPCTISRCDNQQSYVHKRQWPLECKKAICAIYVSILDIRFKQLIWPCKGSIPRVKS